MQLSSLQRYVTERDGKNKISVLSHPAFWVVCVAKIAASFFFGADILTKNYLPFVDYFLQSHLADPYSWAVAHHISFPFPALMLFILATSQTIVGLLPHAGLAAARVPIFIADFAIFLVLIRWLKDKQEKVLWYYWCSPILFAVNYVAGFLDIIPISFLFAFLFFLFKEEYLYAFVLLGLALATKTGLVIVLPFVLIYLFKEYERPLRACGYVLLSCAIYVLWNAGYLAAGSGFWQIALSGKESFLSTINLDFGGVVVYVVPLVYMGLLAGSVAFKRLNKDMFLMFLAFALGTITLFVVPQAGWYCWIIPFFIYFFVKEDRAHVYPFILLTVSYFAFFLIIPDSPFASALPALMHAPLRSVAVNSAFTLLQGSLLLTTIWIYLLGIQQEIKHKILYKPYLIGIAGDSASGKSTLATLIAKVFGAHNTLEVAGDDMHKWERGDPRWAEITHLNPLANKLHDDMEHTLRLKRNESVTRNFYDHARGRFTLPGRVRPKKIIVLQGLHTLYLNRARALLDLKIFLAPDEELRRQWKLERDVEERGSEPEHVLRQLDERNADSKRYIREQEKYADVVISIGQVGPERTIDIQCDNSINLDAFVSLLRTNTGLAVSHEHATDSQRLTIQGSISHERTEEVAYALVPEVGEINRREQEWEDGLNGVLQLFLAHVLLYKARLDHDAF